MEAVRSLLVLALLGASCRSRVPPAAAAADFPQLREQARLVLEAHCGECHLQGYDSTRPGALAIFDLDEPDWSSRMSERQLRSVVVRIKNDLDMNEQPRLIPAADQAVVERYVEAAIERSHPGTERL
jgi:hypothetical protein